ncbi:uncharacterized protein JCM15063_004453 [Sporobolomyces koalae]|uniref:uncharacterized protein n=1 Tax=Sporobolomyces koalae TaxID=500713 RepID=UPI00317B5748
MTVVAPPEGHSSLFFSYRNCSDPARRSRLPGLPLQCFLLVMQSLDELDLVQASHVCTNWRKAILGSSTLWTDLDDVQLHNNYRLVELERVRAIASRSRLVPMIVHFAEFSAVNLREFRLLSKLPRFPTGGFFLSLSSLESVYITCSPGLNYRDDLPDLFLDGCLQAAASGAVSSNVRSLQLDGLNVEGSTFPRFPKLARLKLDRVSIPSLYRFLESCASSLEMLALCQVTSDPPSRYVAQPPSSNGNLLGWLDKDVVAVLSFPKLRHVQICGEGTPLLWVLPTERHTSFMCDTPTLEVLDFGQQIERNDSVSRYDIDYDDDDDYEDEDEDEDEYEYEYQNQIQGPIKACFNLSADPLLSLFRRAPRLRSINFKGTNLTEGMLLSSLTEATPFLRHLALGGTLACVDTVLDRLATLVPHLEYLDVYDEKKFGVQGLNGTIQGYGSYRKLATSAAEKRMSLKALVGTLSPAQLSQLGSKLRFNPDGSFPRITFASIKAELAELVAIRADPPYASPFPPKPGEPAYDKPKSGSKNKNNGVNIVATRETFEQADRLLQDWVTQREEDAAHDWLVRPSNQVLLTHDCGDCFAMGYFPRESPQAPWKVPTSWT